MGGREAENKVEEARRALEAEIEAEKARLAREVEIEAVKARLAREAENKVEETRRALEAEIEVLKAHLASEVEETRHTATLTTVEGGHKLEATNVPLARREYTVAYEKEQSPEVFENFSEAVFDVEEAQLEETSGCFAILQPVAALSVSMSQVRCKEPKKEIVELSLVRRATVTQDKDVLTEGCEADTVLQEPEQVVPEPVELTVSKTTEFAVQIVPAKLARSASTTVLKEPKQPVVEAIVLDLSQDATELEEPRKEPAEIVKLHRSKYSTILKEPIKVIPEPAPLALTESSTELEEPVVPVEEPVQLARSKCGIRMKPRLPKKVVTLVEAVHDFTHQQERITLSGKCGEQSFSENKVIAPEIHLAKDSIDVTGSVEKEKLVRTKTGVKMREPSKSELVLSNSSKCVEQECPKLAVGNTSRDFMRDEVTITENGLDVEEEYDWSYLKWYAGGIATHYLLSDSKRGPVHHHYAKNSGRK